jgi:N-methylhydantoinase B
MWEIVHKSSVYIAEEMGVALKKSALSPNIRERMDHSCAIVNEEGKIVAQAEHIPVHLGSFKIGVSNILKYVENEGIELNEGDMIIFNDPYISGTHLNDVGILAPIYYDSKLVGYVINKAHHVDVGGPIPGSLNPFAKTIYEEGTVIPPLKIMEKGKINSSVLSVIKENFKVPDYSIADINAQIAANRLGITRVRELFMKYSDVREDWEKSIEYTKNLVLTHLNEWPEGTFEAEDYLEWNNDLVPIRLKLNITRKIIADFSGTSNQMENPLNAVLGVTYSAVSFAIRSMLPEIPTNDGFYSIIEINAPEGSLLNPRKPAAVGGGNVETSQRVADVTFLALSKALSNKVPAASSGTMMNIMLGGIFRGRYWSYYETIGGGSGGRPCKPGVSAVQNNMTNTLNTPIEIAEKQFPIFFTKYYIRENSRGNGKYPGGDGIIRAFKVISKARLSVIADRFILGPWGLQGGERGKPGKITISNKNMPSKFSIDIDPNDEVIIETPGGGGYGADS